MATLTINPHLSHTSYGMRWRQWQRIRDFREGADQVKLHGTLYLPAPSGMDLKTEEGRSEYDAYKERASFYPVIDRTIEGITGVAFLQNPTYKLPEKMIDAGMVDALTVDGEPADILAHAIVDEVISVGRMGLLVDMPANESPDQRAYVSKYYAEHIYDWRREFINGRRILTMVLLEEGHEKVNDKDAIRFLRLALKNPDTNPVYAVEEWTFFKDDVYSGAAVNPYTKPARPPVERIPLVRGKPIDFIPFVFVNPKSLQPEIERPPMLDLVDVNRGHYVNSADYEHCLYAGAHDTFYIIGAINDQEKPREIGGGIIWTLPETVKEVGTLSASGTSMDSLLEAIVSKEERMAALGARLIHHQKGGEAETAEAVRLRTRENASVMMKVVDNTEAAMNKVFDYAAIMMDLDPEDCEVTFNRDFVEARLGWDDALKLMQAWQQGGVDTESYFERAKAGGLLPAGLTFDEWKERIERDNAAKAAKAPPAPPTDESDPNATGDEEEDDEGGEDDPDDDGEVVQDGNPYRIEKRGGKYAVVKVADGKVMGTHETLEEAQAQLAALESDE